MARRLTPTFIEKIKPPSQNHKLYFDSRIAGLALRVRSNGLKSWILQYISPTQTRMLSVPVKDKKGNVVKDKDGKDVMKQVERHKQTRYTFVDSSDFDQWPLERVIEEAGKLRKQVEKRIDPAEPVAQGVPFLTVENLKDVYTVNQLCDDYLKEIQTTKRKSSRRNDESMIKHTIRPALGKKSITEVKREDVNTMFRSVVKFEPDKESKQLKKVGMYRANRVLALTKTMFNWAIKMKELELPNPCKHIERYKEHKREVYLSEKQVQDLKKALNTSASPDAADAIRLLLLTGAREMEVLHATWDQFDLEASTWSKPSHSTKQDEDETVPLDIEAIAILRRLHKRKRSKFVFPHRDDPRRPRASIQNSWLSALKRAKLAERVEIDNPNPGKNRRKKLIRWVPIKINGKRLRIHDMRHNFATHLVSRGVPLAVAGALMGHKRAETTQRYSHILDQAKRDALRLGIGAVYSGKKGSAEGQGPVH